jgi:hypothetical protein
MTADKKPTQPRPVVRHTVRTRDGGTKTMKVTRGLAIKLHCTECMGDNHPDDCTSKLCALYPFRGITRAALRGDKA